MEEYIFAFMLMLGSHEMGHQVAADRLNVDMTWYGIEWVADCDEGRAELISAAGFEGQDIMGYALQNPKYSKISGIHKLKYLNDDNGDMLNMGDEYKLFIFASALSDLMNLEIRFVLLNNRTPGLMKLWEL